MRVYVVESFVCVCVCVCMCWLIERGLQLVTNLISNTNQTKTPKKCHPPFSFLSWTTWGLGVRASDNQQSQLEWCLNSREGSRKWLAKGASDRKAPVSVKMLN